MRCVLGCSLFKWKTYQHLANLEHVKFGKMDLNCEVCTVLQSFNIFPYFSIVVAYPAASGGMESQV